MDIKNMLYKLDYKIDRFWKKNKVNIVLVMLCIWLFACSMFMGIYSRNLTNSVNQTIQDVNKRLDNIDNNIYNMQTTINDNSSKLNKIEYTIDSEDVVILSRLIDSEAGGESYDGKVAVGAVVINRTKNSKFPSNVHDVVYSRGQFDPVTYNTMSASPSEESILAAIDALKGYDPTHGALYFYNPKIAKDKWIRSRHITVKIGNHNFAV